MKPADPGPRCCCFKLSEDSLLSYFIPLRRLDPKVAVLPTPTLFLPAVYEQTLKLFPISCRYDIKAEGALTYTDYTRSLQSHGRSRWNLQNIWSTWETGKPARSQRRWFSHGHHPAIRQTQSWMKTLKASARGN